MGKEKKVTYFTENAHVSDGSAGKQVEEDNSESGISKAHTVVEMSQVAYTESADTRVDREPKCAVIPPAFGHQLLSSKDNQGYYLPAGMRPIIFWYSFNTSCFNAKLPFVLKMYPYSEG